MNIQEMPKLESPFVRKQIDGKYVVVDEINPGYEWVFNDDKTMAIEKLNGMCISIYIDRGVITNVWSRGRRVPFFGLGTRTIIEGLLNSYEKGYMEFLPDGQHFGELIGPGSEGNSYKIEKPLWIPFKTYAQKHLRYESWGRYPKTFESISEWFKTLMALYSGHVGNPNKYVEGVVFTHPDGRMAKLRIDMFDWHKGKGHKEE